MKRILVLLLSLPVFLYGCAKISVDDGPWSTVSMQTTGTGTVVTENTEPAQPTEPVEAHSELYIEGLSVEDLIIYFNEVCLDAEMSSSGAPELIQKWMKPITYYFYGDYTQEDIAVFQRAVEQINAIAYFPGFEMVQEPGTEDFPIYFYTPEQMQALLGSNDDAGTYEGYVSFWYTENKITHGWIAYRCDISQDVRSSVILEEIYNGLGPIQDTVLRADSIIYQYSSSNTEFSAVDILILQLLYHPEIRCGMDAEACEEVIRRLYY